MKTQQVRLFDVFLIGPVMVYAGVELAERRPVLAAFILGSGLATVAYNAQNYVKARRRDDD